MIAVCPGESRSRLFYQDGPIAASFIPAAVRCLRGALTGATQVFIHSFAISRRLKRSALEKKGGRREYQELGHEEVFCTVLAGK
jgi:hypothetical protein